MELYQGVPQRVPGGFRSPLEGKDSKTTMYVMQTVFLNLKDFIQCSETFEMTAARMLARVASWGPQGAVLQGWGTGLRGPWYPERAYGGAP